MFHGKDKSKNKRRLSWAKLKFSLVRVVIKVISHSIKVEMEGIVQLSLLFWVGGGEKNEIVNDVVVKVRICHCR